MQFQEFISKVEEYQNANIEAINRAYDLAERTHRHQKRKSGEPYINHPVAVANIILEIGGDSTMICAALLHDVLEDTQDLEKTEKELKSNFSKEVYYLVHALSKDGNITDKNLQQEYFFTQFEEAMKTDITVFFLKLADLIHNLSTISNLKPEKREIWINELKDRYIPMLQDYYHQVSPTYHSMYHELMGKLEKTITQEF